VVDFLKDIGEYDNAVVIFLSDNGPNPWHSEDYPGNSGSKWLEQFDNSLENIGHTMSHYAYRMGWGAASAGPLDVLKLLSERAASRARYSSPGPGSRVVDR
jgi:arylsulfatase